ncbi:MAG: NADH-quinone oxidoreductase subunit L [Planctomycetes bacterium]|nr:NADH-quinone oxidoreductase subunit L [Planctomycetota bacterium]
MTPLLGSAASVVQDGWTAWVILFAPLAVAVIVACVPAIRRRGALAAALSIGAIGLGAALALATYFFPALSGHAEVREKVVSWVHVPLGAGSALEIGFGTRIDALSTVMMLVVTVVGFAIHVYSLGYMHGDPSMGRFFGKLSLFVFSMLGIVVSPNFIQTFVFWELVGVSSYLLIGYYWQKDSAGQAAKKAFMTNRVGDFGFLLGILVVWKASGTFDFEALRAHLATGSGYDAALLGGTFALGAALVFCGAMGKSAQFPLHVWLPDAMEGPTPVSALMHAATMVAAGVYMITRCFFLFEGTTWAPTLVAWLGGITAFMAATIAVTQRDIKKILAYSTLSQLGYMTLALGAGAYTGAMFHLTTHAFFKALLFLGAGSVIHACHTQDIFEMGGLRKVMPSTWRTFLLGTLALCGIFPFAGFWSKDEILGSVLHAEHLPGHLFLYGLGTLVAGLTSFYMGRALFVTFLGTHRGPKHADDHGHGGGHGGHDDHGHAHGPHESPKVMTLPLWFLAVFAVVIGFVGVPGNVGGAFGLSNRFEHFLHAWTAGHEEGAFHVSVALVSSVVAVLGLVLAWRVYGTERTRAEDPLPERLGSLHRIWRNLYYVDAFYVFLVKKVQQGVAWVCWLFERRVLIGGVVNGLSQGARLLGDRVRRTQGGRLSSYVTWVLLGSVAVALAVLLR